MSITDAFRAWRRNFKAKLPFVRRREHRILQRKYGDLIDALGWTAPAATQARLQAIKPTVQPLIGEVCLFVSFASSPRLKRHVHRHVQNLLRVGVQVILILNTDLPASAFALDAELTSQLSGVFVRENTGFDFAAWAHVLSLCEGIDRWTRLYLVNDSIVGPINEPDFDRLIERIRASNADVVGLTENRSPMRHVQSFFLVLNVVALRNPIVQHTFSSMRSLPSKAQVIDVYETRLTQVLTHHGLRCEALFQPLSDDPYSANDTSLRWAELIHAGFPYIKSSVLERFSGSAQVKSLVPTELNQRDD